MIRNSSLALDAGFGASRRTLLVWSLKSDRSYPFILVLYDAQRHRGFWLDVQNYVDEI